MDGLLLPPEFEMLRRHGCPAASLREAARLARRWDVAPVDALLAAGLLPAERAYRALARELGLPFLDGEIALHDRTMFPQAVVSGVAPLAEEDRTGARFVLAPAGDRFADLARRRGALSPGLAIATPAALRLAVFAARGEAIARFAAEDLARRSPQDSFRGGVTLGQIVASQVAGTAVTLAAVAASGSVVTAASLLLSIPFLGLAAIKLAAAGEPIPVAPPIPDRRAPDATLPVYTVLVPLHRERTVLPKLLAALRSLDYPAAKLDVMLLVEEGDRETAGALAEHDLPAWLAVVTVPSGVPQTKPRALNVGLALARGEYVVVYDAEDVPDPGQVRAAVATFARSPPDVVCLQARLVIDNTRDSWLTRFFTVEYGALFDVVNPALARFDLPVPIGGTSNHLRVEVVRKLGGWDAWNVTEDADLAIRLAIAGYRVADLPSATLEEAPRSLRAWLAQRARWMKGFLQVSITHSRRPIRTFGRLGLARMLGAVALVFGAVASAVVFPIFTAIVVVGLASGTMLHPDGLASAVATGIAITIAVAGLLAMVVPPVVAIARRRWWALLPWALGMPLYYGLVSLGAWRGCLELVLDPDRWNKTPHGLALTSRAGTAVSSARGDPSRPPPAHDRD